AAERAGPPTPAAQCGPAGRVGPVMRGRDQPGDRRPRRIATRDRHCRSGWADFPEGAAKPTRSRGPVTLTATNITARLNRRVILENAGFAAAPGQITAIVGPNGSGKTTL